MASVPYLIGDGTTVRQRSIRTNGSSEDLLEFYSSDLETRIGATADSPATSATQTNQTIFSLLRGVLAQLIGSSGESQALAVPITTTLNDTNSVVLTCTRANAIALEIGNAGATALAALDISVRASANASWRIVLNTADHFGAGASGNPIPQGSILRACSNASGAIVDPTTLAAGASAIMHLDLRDFYANAIRIRARVASGSGSLNVYAGLK